MSRSRNPADGNEFPASQILADVPRENFFFEIVPGCTSLQKTSDEVSGQNLSMELRF
jgi:hypothetical protein